VTRRGKGIIDGSIGLNLEKGKRIKIKKKKGKRK
jgi:hypothetical protein